MKDPYEKTQKNTSRLAKIGSTVSWPSPCRSEVQLKFKMMCIDSSDLDSKTHKSTYNKRSAGHLGLASVLDIFPEISTNGFNTHPAIGEIDKHGNIGVLAGMRRREAVSLVESGKFYIQVCSELTEDEKKAYASTSDVYDEPTVLDFGYTLKDYISDSSERGQVVTYDELATIFKASKGKVSEAIRFTELPIEFINLFPSLKSIGYRYLRDALKLHKSLKKDFIKVIQSDGVVAASANTALIITDNSISDTTNQDIVLAVTKLKRAIALSVNDIQSIQSNIKSSIWDESIERASVKVKRVNGKVQITFDEEALGQKLSEALFDVLK